MNNNRAHDRLHELFSEDPLEDIVADHDRSATGTGNDDTVGFLDEGDQLVDDALSMTTLAALSPEAQELLIGLTDTASSLEPATRQRLVEAADRGMKHRREDASPLPRLLFVVRNRKSQSLDAVAASIAADDKLLSKVERGETSVQELGAKGVASWIQFFDLPKTVALDALRLTFLRADADQAAAGARTELSEEHDKFIGEVSDLLQQS
jgi:hypothetical protein